MTEQELDHIKWIGDRLIYKHGESKNIDYIIKLNNIIEKYDK